MLPSPRSARLSLVKIPKLLCMVVSLIVDYCLRNQFMRKCHSNVLSSPEASNIRLNLAPNYLHNAIAHGITVTPNPDPAQLQSLSVLSWPTWGCGVSSFPWTYDEQETCLLLEGDVTVTPDGGEPVRFGTGDLVVFDAGLSCTWDVHAPVRKHFRFG